MAQVCANHARQGYKLFFRFAAAMVLLRDHHGPANINHRDEFALQPHFASGAPVIRCFVEDASRSQNPSGSETCFTGGKGGVWKARSGAVS